jgi:hypothetical protein
MLRGMPFRLGKKKDDPGRDAGRGDDYAPGWDALDAVFAAAFVGQKPHHWATDTFLPAQEGIWGISAYREGDAWFYVTYGLSDLFDAFGASGEGSGESDGIKCSGFGFELTMRVLSNDATPPVWPVELLNKLGKYVYQTRGGFGHGHRLDPGGPITGGNPPTRLTALAFATDREFEATDTPTGRVEFVTALGITADELARMKASSTDTVLAELMRQSPALVTDPAR